MAEDSAWCRRLSLRLKSLNKSDVARALNWPETRISNMLGRQALPNAVDAAKLCKVLGTSVEWIFLGLPPTIEPKERYAAGPDARPDFIVGLDLAALKQLETVSGRRKPRQAPPRPPERKANTG